jgi:hypothetical protein
MVSTSGLSQIQVESLLLYKRVLSGELTLETASKLRTRTKGESSRPVKVGAFYRTVQQGRENLKEAVMTVTVGIWLGYVKVEDLRRLFDLVGNTPLPLEQPQISQLMPVLESLIQKIVT